MISAANTCLVVESAVYDDNTADPLQGGFTALNLRTVTPQARERETWWCLQMSQPRSINP